MKGSEAYWLFRAMRIHFNTKPHEYDFTKYNGRLWYKPSLPEKQRIAFEKLGATFPTRKQLIGAILANFIVDPMAWADQISSGQGKSAYYRWRSRIGALPYYFENDLDMLIERGGGIRDALKGDETRHPPVLRHLLSGSICPETFIILDMLTGFAGTLDGTMGDDPVWEIHRDRMLNYRAFLNVDLEKYKSILSKKLNNC